MKVGEIGMIVDFHTHTYPEKIAAKTVDLLEKRSETTAATDGTLAGLKASMDRAGVDISVVLPVVTAPKQYERINDTAYRVTEAFEETGIWSFGGIHPDNDNYKEILNDIKAHGLKGIKLHPDYQETFFNDIRYKRIISYATELGLIVVVHAGVDIGLPSPVHCTVDMSVEILDEVKPDKLVLAHMGGWQMWDQVLAKLCGREVYLDTAFSCGDISWTNDKHRDWHLCNRELYLDIIKAHGADKILFATDSPWVDQKEGISCIRQLPLTEEDMSKILGDNAVKLLQL
jgi:hypothetical protein